MFNFNILFNKIVNFEFTWPHWHQDLRNIGADVVKEAQSSVYYL